MVKKNTCVFISGQGTNLRNLIFHSRDNSFPVKISLVITNKKEERLLNDKRYLIKISKIISLSIFNYFNQMG